MKQPADQRHTGYKWLIFAALGSGILLDSFEGVSVNVILPTLVVELDAAFAHVQWVVLAFTLTKTAIMLGVGRLGDMFGKRPIFLSGTAAFLIASIMAGLAPNIETLLLFRVIQAVGGAFATALSMGIVIETFPASERGKALGLFSAAVSVGGIAGPTIAGILLDFLSWRWIFFVGTPFSIASFILAWRYLPSFRPGGRQRFDWAGAALFAAGLLALMLYLTFGQRAGYGSAPMLALLASSLLLLVLFVGNEVRSSDPLLDLSIFRNLQFSLNLAMRLICYVVIGGVILLYPFYLSGVLQLQPVLIGILLTTPWIFFGLASPFAGLLSDRFGYRLIAAAGLVMMAFGCYTVSTLDADTTILGFVLRISPLGLGMGFFQSPNNSAVLGSAPRERLGVVSGINVIARTLGRTSGVAALGALWAGRIAAYAGAGFGGEVTEAAPVIQIAALRDVTYAALAVVALGLLLSAWGMLQAPDRLEGAR